MRNTLQNPGDPVLSLTAEYALRACLALARHGDARPMRAEEVADRTGTPRNYMSKTLNALAKEGIVRSRRGPAGGFTLAIAPEALTVARIAGAFSIERPPARCLLGDRPCSPDDPCTAHDRWVDVLATSRAALQVTVAELLGSQDRSLASSQS